MPLIDLKTDLKSLTYGTDRPGGGSSKEPFITEPIPEGEETTQGAREDFLLRQGAIRNSGKDVSRLTKLFFSTTKGLSFTTTTNLLSRTSVKTEATLGPAYAGGAINQGVYLPTSTLAQVGVGFTGTHLNLLGLDPTSPMSGVVEGGLFPGGGLIRYEQVVRDLNNQEGDSSNNRLVSLYDTKISGLTPTPKNSLVASSPLNILSYGGGPGSILGVGKTIIKRASNTTGINEYGWQVKDFTAESFSGVSNAKTSLDLSNSLGASYDYFTYNEISNQLVPDPTPEILGINPLDGSQLKRFGPQDNNQTLSTLEDSGSLVRISKENSKVKVADAKTTFNQNNPSGSVDTVTFGAGSTDKDNNLSLPAAITSSLNYAKSGISQAKTDFNDNYYSPLKITDSLVDPTGVNILPEIPAGQYGNNVLHGVNSDQQIVTLKTAYNKPDGNPITHNNANRTREYNTENKFKQYRYGNLGSPQNGNNQYTYGGDKFNANITNDLNTTLPSTNAPNNQLFKFYLNLLDPQDPSANNYLYFQAYVDSFTDNISAKYDDYTYTGRGYPSFKYKGFSRDISLSFTIVATNPDQIVPIYDKLNRLIQNLAPNYSNSGYIRGNFVKLTFGDYLNNVPGIIKGFSLNPIFDVGFDIGTGENSSGKQLPKGIKVDGFNFTPITDNKSQLVSSNSKFISY